MIAPLYPPKPCGRCHRVPEPPNRISDSWCLECRREYSRRWRAAHPDDGAWVPSQREIIPRDPVMYADHCLRLQAVTSAIRFALGLPYAMVVPTRPGQIPLFVEAQ